jgi:hypothetical protein
MQATDFITHRDMMLTRVILAIQAETDLDAIDVEGLRKTLARAATNNVRIAEALPAPGDLMQHIKKLAFVGWLHLDETNPHVTVTAPGIITCGPLDIPEDIGTSFGESFDMELLS